ncbi:hypothetical protein ACOMHN_058505 [Nucella lapillus]
MTNPDEIKDRSYEELESLMASVPQFEKLIILGDFNARVGTNHQAWDRIIGKHGVCKCNSNGLLLLILCASHDLAITNTMFRLPTRKKTTWMHPRSRHWHVIDYVIIRAKDRQDVRITKAVCGPATRHHQDWFDENDSKIHALLEDKRCLLRTHQNDPSSVAKKAAFTNMRNTVQAKLRSMQDSWLSAMADEIQGYADRHDTKRARRPPSYEEVNKAIKQMTTGKDPGPDAIHAEVYKTGGETIRNQLTSLFQSMWKQEHLPQEFRDATIVHIYKRKGNRQSCDNHRGISLLSIAGKILARVLLNRLLEHLEQG